MGTSQLTLTKQHTNHPHNDRHAWTTRREQTIHDEQIHGKFCMFYSEVCAARTD